MKSFTIRIDACFNFEVEAEDEDAAIAAAEAMFDANDMGDGFSHITETLAFTDEDEEEEN